ncbi:MAG: thiamine phosphate synthase [Acidimicrobiia bacterium]|nr:thiamine phosphate synthase [Acidimicrobiia bacterium]
MTRTRPRVARLHVIVDVATGQDGLDVAAAALDGGASWLQVRIKDEPDRRRLALAAGIAALCRERGATCLVNDRADIALAVEADGVHVGADDLPVPVLRRILGTEAVIGATARDPETARRLEAEGATYLGVGPVYPSTTKDGLPGPFGPALVTRVGAAVGIPVVAISGVTAGKVPELLAAGAHGVAVIGAVAGAPDRVAATAELLCALGPEG